MFLEDMRYELVKFFNFMAFIVIPFLLIGKLAGFWFQELFIIVASWVCIASLGAILAGALDEKFEKVWPLLLGLAWVCVWWPINRLAGRLAVYKAGPLVPGWLEDELARHPPSIELPLPWWSSLSFQLAMLFILIGAGYGISYLRSNR